MFLNMLLPNLSITFSDIFTVEKKILINKEGNSAAVITKKEKKL